MDALRWTALAELEPQPEWTKKAALVVHRAATDLVCGDLRWTDSASFAQRLIVLHDDASIYAVIAHYLEVNDDPEIALGAGARVIRVPMVTGSPAAVHAASARIGDLVRHLREIHGPQRISIQIPSTTRAWDQALTAASFVCDSRMSIRKPALANVTTLSGVIIRPAEASDASAAAALFRESMQTLDRASLFVAPNESAAVSVYERYRTCFQGRTQSGSDVQVATGVDGLVVAVLEVTEQVSPAAYAIQQTPLGESLSLDWIAVALPWRGRGIGRQLVTSALDSAARRSVTAAFCYHLTSQYGPAAFWESSGFRPAWETWELGRSEEDKTVDW